MRTIAVVGAGWAGIATALTLSRAGVQVSVYEATRVPGGRARRVDRDGHVVDNGQHLMLGAYERTIALIHSLHSELEAPLVTLPLTLCTAPSVLPSLRIRAPDLPEPWNLLTGLIAADGLLATEKISAMAWAARTLQGGTIDPAMTVAALIGGQPLGVRKSLWDPLCVAALNTPPEHASATVFVEVLRRTFFGTKNASRMIIPTSDLTAIFPGPALAEIRTHGGNVFLGAAVKSIANTESGVSVGLRDGTEHFDAVVTAVAPQHMQRLLSQEASAIEITRSLGSLTYEPITTLYFEFSHVTPSPDNGVPMRMLNGEPGQWLFWSRLSNGRWRAGVVVSAHRGHDCDASLVTNTLKQLAESYCLPAPVWQFVITERRATYSCSPAQSRLLMTIPKRIGRIHFAGDWCYPQLPATIEAAVISGEAAAKAAIETLHEY